MRFYLNNSQTMLGELSMMSGIRLPKSALLVLQCLDRQGHMPPRDISKTAKVPLRTVTYALGRLVDSNLCQKIPNLYDMRRTLYAVDQEKAHLVFLRYGLMF